MTPRFPEQPRPSDTKTFLETNLAKSKQELAKPLDALKQENVKVRENIQSPDSLTVAQEYIGTRPKINFESDFHLDQSLEYFQEQDPRNPDKAALLTAKRILEPLGKVEILDKGRIAFDNELNALSVGSQTRTELEYAYNRHQGLKKHLAEISNSKRSFDEHLEGVKPVKDPDSITGKMSKFKNEVVDTFFNKMSGGQQFAVVGGLLAGLALLAQAEPETDYYLYKFKETLFGLGKLGILGVVANSGVALFNNGKSALDMLEEKKPRIDTEAYWKKNFPSAPEETNKLVLFGADMNAMDLIKKLHAAKKDGSHEVETGINPDKVSDAAAYKALDAIDKKYGRNQHIDKFGKSSILTLEEEYGNREPPITLYELMLSGGLRAGDIAFSKKKINEAKAKAASKQVPKTI